MHRCWNGRQANLRQWCLNVRVSVCAPKS